jgi:plastocyanin
VGEGLADFVAESPKQAVLLENDGTGFSPSLAAIQTGQPLEMRSTDHQLHTVQMKKEDGSWVLNVPILGSGTSRTLAFDDPKGLVEIQCKVHQARERRSHIVILNHRFYAFTDAEGAFALRDVPARRLTLSAFHPEQGEASASLQLSPQGSAQVKLVFHRR